MNFWVSFGHLGTCSGQLHPRQHGHAPHATPPVALQHCQARPRPPHPVAEAHRCESQMPAVESTLPE